MSCNHCQQKQSQYKILQADLQFEVKKMSEDLATQKVSLELHYQKESKKQIEGYNKQKWQREEENKKWIQKYDRIVSEYQQKIQILNQSYAKREKEILEFQASQMNKRQKQIKIQHLSSIQNLENNHKNAFSSLQKEFERKCLESESKRTEQIRLVNESSQKHINEIVYEYECKIKELKNEIRIGNERLERIKIESHQGQTSLYNELYQRKQEINELKYTIDQLKTSISLLQDQIRHKDLQMEVIKQQHQEYLQNLREAFQSEKKGIIQDFTLQMEGILRDNLEDCQKYEQVVKEISDKRENQIKIYETNMKEVKQFVEERPSREEDLEKINILKDLLNQKQKQFQKAFNEAKGYRLELNNKEQVFNKIFCGHSSPLNIEKIGKRKDVKIGRTSSSNLKDMSKYQSVNTFHTISTTTDFGKKQKLTIQPKSTKFF